ncbi:hypothetical protein D5086_019538 [Populus alba]|uniref:Uncharacterized protein n=1 Tax=Populus alba TaxID=43335 RepID=A0ACC4BIZ8_POPAL
MTTTRKTTAIAMVMRKRERCGLPGTRLSNRGSFYLVADSRGQTYSDSSTCPYRQTANHPPPQSQQKETRVSKLQSKQAAKLIPALWWLLVQNLDPSHL